MYEIWCTHIHLAYVNVDGTCIIDQSYGIYINPMGSTFKICFFFRIQIQLRLAGFIFRRSVIYSLKRTVLPWQYRPKHAKTPKERNNPIPSIHFQVLLLLVSVRVSVSYIWILWLFKVRDTERISSITQTTTSVNQSEQQLAQRRFNRWEKPNEPRRVRVNWHKPGLGQKKKANHPLGVSWPCIVLWALFKA